MSGVTNTLSREEHSRGLPAGQSDTGRVCVSAPCWTPALAVPSHPLGEGREHRASQSVRALFQRPASSETGHPRAATNPVTPQHLTGSGRCCFFHPRKRGACIGLLTALWEELAVVRTQHGQSSPKDTLLGSETGTSYTPLS